MGFIISCFTSCCTGNVKTYPVPLKDYTTLRATTDCKYETLLKYM